MKLQKNLETAIAHLDNLLSQINTDHPSFANYERAVNTSVQALKVVMVLKMKKQKLHNSKKLKKEQTNGTN